MRKTTLFQFIALLLLGTLFFAACRADKVEDLIPDPECADLEITWVADIQPIVQTYCSYLGCHSAGNLNGDFTTYEKMKPLLDGGRVENRVFETSSMPPPNATGPRELSEEDSALLACWLEQGHPKE